jgi:hypothetical protein
VSSSSVQPHAVDPVNRLHLIAGGLHLAGRGVTRRVIGPSPSTRARRAVHPVVQVPVAPSQPADSSRIGPLEVMVAQQTVS